MITKVRFGKPNKPQHTAWLRQLLLAVSLTGIAATTAADNSYSVRVESDVLESSGGGAVVFLVTKSGDRSGSVQYITENGTASGGDNSSACQRYDGSVDYMHQSDRVSFTQTQTEREVTVTVCGDQLYEDSETVVLRIFDPSSNGTIATESATATLINDDDPPRLSVDTFRATEGDSGSQAENITLRLDTASGKPAVFDYALEQSVMPNGRATPGVGCDNTDSIDFIAESGTVSIPPGQTETTLQVTICGDTVVESPSQVFQLSLRNPVDVTLSSSQNSQRLNLTYVDNDEYPQPELTAINPSSMITLERPLSTRIQLNGQNFLPNSIVKLDGNPVSAVYQSATRLRITVSKVGLSSGAHEIVVENPAPGGGSSNPRELMVTTGYNPNLIKQGVRKRQIDQSLKDSYIINKLKKSDTKNKKK